MQSSHPDFPKNVCLTKMAVKFLNFQFLAKTAKHKNAYISKTVLERAISTKILSVGYLCIVAIPIFQNILSHQKW